MYDSRLNPGSVHKYRATQQVSGGGVPADLHFQTGEYFMTLKKIAICTAALVVAATTSQLAQAAGKGTPNLGVSGSAPGHITPPSGTPGKSENAPGDIKHDKDLKDAKTLAPGSTNPNKK
jgi:hypothetical protein